MCFDVNVDGDGANDFGRRLTADDAPNARRGRAIGGFVTLSLSAPSSYLIWIIIRLSVVATVRWATCWVLFRAAHDCDLITDGRLAQNGLYGDSVNDERSLLLF